MLFAIYLILTVLCFICFSAYKAWKYSTMPIHSRLELYPVPKEAGRAEYGGSYYEELEWWTKPRQISRLGELKDMLLEMFFIKKLFQNQKRLWWASYAFHLGIYFLVGWTILLLISTVWPQTFVLFFASAIGIISFTLAFTGNTLLILRRIFDPTLKKYTTPQEYFNLILIFAVLITGIYAWSALMSPFEAARLVLSFDSIHFAPAVSLHLILLGIMFLYIPLSKMNHYIGKYFSFHRVLWENEPNLPGSKVEQELKEAAAHPPQTQWSAAHINPVKE